MSRVSISDDLQVQPALGAAGVSSWLVALCAIVISACLAAILYLLLPVSWPVAAGAGAVSLVVLAISALLAARRRDSAAIHDEFRRLDRLANALAEELSGAKHRLEELQETFDQKLDEAVETRFGLLTADLQMLEARLDEMAPPSRYAQPRIAAPAPEMDETASGEEAGPEDGADSASDTAEFVRTALKDNRLEVFLQPVVSLPQRHVRYYEAISRLRGSDGGLLLPAEYLPIADAAGLMPLVDSAMLLRCMQIIRRMNERSRQLAIFCNVSPASLVDGEFFPPFLRYLSDHRELADSLVFEFPQAAFEELGPLERSSLDVLIELGFRFSVDSVGDLDIDGSAYAARRVRFVKLDAAMLLNPAGRASPHIHPADLASLLARSGIELIAAKVETEAELVDLIDYDIRLAQGNLFSPPRPVRGEILGDPPAAAGWARAS